MASGQGSKPPNIEVVVALFRDVRDSLAGFLAIDDPTPEQRIRMMAICEAKLAASEEGAHCSAIGRSWDRTMSRKEVGRRIRDLQRDYERTYGALPVEAAALAAD